MRHSFFDTQGARLMFVQPQVEFDLSYTDTAYISLSTTVLFNYPFPGFAKLPLSLVVSLELFSCKVGGTSLPPSPFELISDISDRLHAPQTNDQHKTTSRDITRISRIDHQHTPIVHLTASQNDIHHGLACSTGRRAETSRAC